MQSSFSRRNDLRNFSCSFSRLYESGGFYEGAGITQALVDIAEECQWTANVYPPYGYDRPQPANLLSRNADFSAEIMGACKDWNTTYARGSSTDLFTIENGLLFNRCLYKAFGGEILQMYETNKPYDRPWRPDLNPACDLQTIRQPRHAETDFFYLGSIGSDNYGHWLIDDLTRAKTLVAHFRPDRIPAIVLNSHFPAIDAVREQSLRALTYGIADIEVLFLEYRSSYLFPRLFFVTPSSYHPVLKCPQGVAFLRDHFVDQAARMSRTADRLDIVRGKHLFVTRRAVWRNVINLEDVIAYFRNFSFDIVELDALTFIEQVRTFSRAKIVVGVMGAGMTNVVFSPEGALVVHLAPEGWKEPFFWDLAAVKKHRYAVVFGESSIPQAPQFTPFTVDLSQLDIVTGWS